MNNSAYNDESITGINIVPLVDVVLVLLIIFMATAPLIQRRALKVNVPKVAHSEPKATQTLNITINEKHEIFIAQTQLPKSELAFQLASLYKADPSLHIAVLGDQALPYGEVVELLDIVRSVGIKKVALEVASKKKD